MLIVSQDKDTITNFNNVDILGIGDPVDDNKNKFKMIVNTESDSYVIAKYETEERAKEVLQEIIKKCQNNRNDMCYIVYEMPEK